MNIKKILFLLMGFGLVFAGLSTALAFEGVVDYHITSGNHQTDIEYLIKGHKLRFNGGEKMQNAAGFMDFDQKKLTILMAKQKMYMVSDATDYKKMSQKVQGKFSDTGHSEEILGQTCEEYLYHTDKGDAHIWLATKLGFFPGFGGQASDMDSWVKMAQDKGLFPMKSTYYDKDGKEKTSMVATKVAAQSVDDGNFQVPDGYKEMTMPKVDMGKMAPNASDALKNVKIPGF